MTVILYFRSNQVHDGNEEIPRKPGNVPDVVVCETTSPHLDNHDARGVKETVIKRDNNFNTFDKANLPNATKSGSYNVENIPKDAIETENKTNGVHTKTTPRRRSISLEPLSGDATAKSDYLIRPLLPIVPRTELIYGTVIKEDDPEFIVEPDDEAVDGMNKTDDNTIPPANVKTNGTVGTSTGSHVTDTKAVQSLELAEKGQHSPSQFKTHADSTGDSGEVDSSKPSNVISDEGARLTEAQNGEQLSVIQSLSRKNVPNKSVFLFPDLM